GLVFFTQQYGNPAKKSGNGRIRVVNVTTTSASFGATVIPAGDVQTLIGASKVVQPVGISIEGKDAIDVTDVGVNVIYRMNEQPKVTTIVGTSGAGGFSGDGKAATAARLL